MTNKNSTLTEEDRVILNWVFANGIIRNVYPNRTLLDNTNVLNQITEMYIRLYGKDINCGCSTQSKLMKRINALKKLL